MLSKTASSVIAVVLLAILGLSGSPAPADEAERQRTVDRSLAMFNRMVGDPDKTWILGPTMEAMIAQASSHCF